MNFSLKQIGLLLSVEMRGGRCALHTFCMQVWISLARGILITSLGEQALILLLTSVSSKECLVPRHLLSLTI